MRINKKFSFIGLTAFVISLAIFGILGGKASAATLSVDANCTLPEAIGAINHAQDENGCTRTGSNYGTTDTVSLPTGTQTISADLPNFSKSVTVSGAGKSSTTINMNGHLGFNADYGTPNGTKTVRIEKMSIQGAVPLAIRIQKANSVTLDELDVSNSTQAVMLETVEDVFITNSSVHDNTDSSVDQGKVAGVSINPSSYVEGQQVNVTVDNVRIFNNTGDIAGLYISPDSLVAGSDDNQLIGDSSISVKSSVVSNNNARLDAGLFIVTSGGPISPTKVTLEVDSTTIANNSVTVTSPQVVTSVQYLPIVAGFIVTGILNDAHHFTNVTVAYNTVINPAPDNRNSVAGFLGSLGVSGSNLNILNTTVVGNHTTQPSAAFNIPAFFATKMGLNESFQVTSAMSGSSATNVLVAQNTSNGVPRSCFSQVNTTLLGFDLGNIDLTPQNLGHNMSDDQSCTGYTYEPHLYDTIAHEVADNGGPIPTIKLLPGSPAINGGGQVQGITTDARGVARNGYYSVGAYQGELLAATTANSTLAKTGVVTVSAVIVGFILLVVLVYTYADYLRHRRPLVQADPFARQTYTYRHHISTVTIPLLKYRVHISFNRKPSSISKF